MDGSEILALKLMRYAMEKKYHLTVHYCSLENKHFGQIYMQNLGAAKDDTSYVMSEKDFYLKTVKAFGDDAICARKIFDEHRATQYIADEENGYIRFSPDCARLLRETDMELAVSYNVREMRGREEVIRELRLDYAKASDFDSREL